MKNSISISQSSILRNPDLLFWYDPNKRGSNVGNTVLDLSGRNLTATWQVSTPNLEDGGWRIDGNGQMLRSVLDTKSFGDFTISFWFKIYTGALPLGGGLASIPVQLAPLSNGNKHLTFDFNDDDNGNLSVTLWVYWNASGNPYSSVGKTSGGVPSDWYDGTWRHYTFVRSVTNAPYTSHYMNGVLVSSNVNRAGSQTDLFCDSTVFDVNFNYGNLYNVGDLLGPVYAYKRALTDAQVLWNYNADKNRFI